MLDLKNKLKEYIPSLFEMWNNDVICWSATTKEFQSIMADDFDPVLMDDNYSEWC